MFLNGLEGQGHALFRSFPGIRWMSQNMHSRGPATSPFHGLVDMLGRAEYNLGTGGCDEQKEDSDSWWRSGPGDFLQPSMAIAPKETGERLS